MSTQTSTITSSETPCSLSEHPIFSKSDITQAILCQLPFQALGKFFCTCKTFAAQKEPFLKDLATLVKINLKLLEPLKDTSEKAFEIDHNLKYFETNPDSLEALTSLFQRILTKPEMSRKQLEQEIDSTLQQEERLREEALTSATEKLNTFLSNRTYSPLERDEHDVLRRSAVAIPFPDHFRPDLTQIPDLEGRLKTLSDSLNSLNDLPDLRNKKVLLFNILSLNSLPIICSLLKKDALTDEDRFAMFQFALGENNLLLAKVILIYLPLTGHFGLGAALHMAAAFGNLDMTQWILELPNAAKIHHGDGLSGLGDVLRVAAVNGYTDVVQMILDHPNAAEIPVNGRYGLGYTLETLVTTYVGPHNPQIARPEIALKILSHRNAAQLSEIGRGGLGHLLSLAAQKGYDAIALMLLLNHQNSDKIPATGEFGLGMALINAAQCGSIKIVQMILNHPNAIEIPVQGPDGLSAALARAEASNNAEIAKAISALTKVDRIPHREWGKLLVEGLQKGHIAFARVILDHQNMKKIPIAGPYGLEEAQAVAERAGYTEISQALQVLRSESASSGLMIAKFSHFDIV